MRINFDHEIDNNPQPEEAGTITVTATIFGDDDEFDTPFTTRSHSIQDFFGCDEDEDSDCQIVRELKCFLLMEAIIDDDDVIGDAMRKLVAYIDGASNNTRFRPASNNTRFRPASKVVVKTLIRKVYTKNIEKENMNKKKKKNSLEECTICLEEFKNGGRVVPLACGHEFDEECIVKWLETSHVCPLCRYELPCEDQMN
ncbi:hypothetical protein YC2023_075300 [Brassica napus]